MFYLVEDYLYNLIILSVYYYARFNFIVTIVWYINNILHSQESLPKLLDKSLLSRVVPEMVRMM